MVYHPNIYMPWPMAAYIHEKSEARTYPKLDLKVPIVRKGNSHQVNPKSWKTNLNQYT